MRVWQLSLVRPRGAQTFCAAKEPCVALVDGLVWPLERGELPKASCQSHADTFAFPIVLRHFGRLERRKGRGKSHRKRGLSPVPLLSDSSGVRGNVDTQKHEGDKGKKELFQVQFGLCDTGAKFSRKLVFICSSSAFMKRHTGV